MRNISNSIRCNQVIKAVCVFILATITTTTTTHGQGYEAPKVSGDLKNKPEREEVFKDWGLGMFVHWSFDSQLGSVISHSMDYASRDYLDRYVNELPKTFNPTKYDPDKWMEIAKLAGVKYMVLTTKHHNGFCMWDTKTTDFSIMKTPYAKDIVKQYVDACRRHGLKVGFYYSPGGNLLINMGPMPSGIAPLEQEERFRELALWMFVNDEAIHDIRPCVTAGTKDVYYTQSKDGKYVYAFLTQFTDNDPKGNTQWGRSKRKEILLKELKSTAETKVRVLGQEHRTEKFNPRHDIGTRFQQKEGGLKSLSNVPNVFTITVVGPTL